MSDHDVRAHQEPIPEGICRACRKAKIPPDRIYTCSPACSEDRDRLFVHAELDELLRLVKSGYRFPRRPVAR